jgi:plastocyanin
MFTQPLLLLATLAAATLAAPTSHTPDQDHNNNNHWQPPSKTASAPQTTHTVVAGRGGEGTLRFDPDNIVAAPGAIVEFHFLPANHSVVEASFDAPCVPKDEASIFSGFFPVAKNADGGVAQSGEVFQFEVRDDKPVWFYCAQGRHCQAGMVGVVNQGEKTLREFREAAGRVTGGVGVQGQVQGGWRGENPNPLAGF